MTDHRGSLHHDPPGSRTHLRHGAGHFPFILMALGGLASLLLLNEGFRWWRVPAVLTSTHALLGLGIVVAVRWMTSRHEAAGDGVAGGGQLLRHPRAYDWLVSILTLGRERAFRREMLELARVERGESVLDVGAGTGTLAVLAAERAGPRGRVVAVEPAAEVIAFARGRAERRGVTVDFRQGSAQQLPCGDAEYDVVLCTMVLHHLPEADRPTAIAEMRRVLRPGGRLVIVELDRRRSLVTLFHGLRDGMGRDVIGEARSLLEGGAFASVASHRLRSRGMAAIVATASGEVSHRG